AIPVKDSAPLIVVETKQTPAEHFRHFLAHKRSASLHRKASHCAIWSIATYSFGLCACAIEPGPQTTVGMPARWNCEPSVPNETLPISLLPASSCASATTSLSGPV